MTGMSKEKYRPVTIEQKLGYLTEECGEVLAAVGKAERWGLDCYNPEVPEEERETNREWILRELQDLKRAIIFVESALQGVDDPEVSMEENYSMISKSQIAVINKLLNRC